MDIKIIASQVEEESQWSTLKVAGVIWGQGRILGGLEPIPGISPPPEPQLILRGVLSGLNIGYPVISSSCSQFH